MVRSVLGKVMWLGRATSALVGLVVLFALAIGAANSALAHTTVDNKLFHLGHDNPVGRLSALTGTLTSAVLKLDNNGTGTALKLEVGTDKAPMKVNAAAGTATGLSADELDGKDSSAFLGKTEKAQDATHADSADQAANAGTLEGKTASDFAAALHDHDSRYYTETEVDTALTGKANTTHQHSGTDITSGQVADAQIVDTVTRDSEVMTRVLAGDGPGSGLDADTVDGKEPGLGFTCANQSAVRFSVPGFVVSGECPAALFAGPPAGTTVVYRSTSEDKTFNVMHTGPANSSGISINAVGYTAGGSGWGTVANTCSGTSLSPGQTCSFTVRKNTNTSITSGQVALFSSAGTLSWPLSYQP